MILRAESKLAAAALHIGCVLAARRAQRRRGALGGRPRPSRAALGERPSPVPCQTLAMRRFCQFCSPMLASWCRLAPNAQQCYAGQGSAASSRARLAAAGRLGGGRHARSCLTRLAGPSGALASLEVPEVDILWPRWGGARMARFKFGKFFLSNARQSRRPVPSVVRERWVGKFFLVPVFCCE